MLFLYDVYCNGEYVMQVTALNSEDACNRAYMSAGSASKYTGKGYDSFTAKMVRS